MNKYIAYFSLLFVAFITMPTVSFGLLQNADCKSSVTKAATWMWAGEGIKNGFENFYSNTEKKVYADKESLQKFRKKYSDAIKDESLLGNWKYTQPLSCDDKGCLQSCGLYSTTCKNGQKLKDCHFDIYKCRVALKIEEEYKAYMVQKICNSGNNLSEADKKAIQDERNFQKSGMTKAKEKPATNTVKAEIATPTLETGSVGPAYADNDDLEIVEAHEPEQPLNTDTGFDFAAASAAETERKNSTVIKPNSTPKVVEPEEVKNTTPTNSRARASANGKPAGTRSANAKTGTDGASIDEAIKDINACITKWTRASTIVGYECSINKNLATNEKVKEKIEALEKACKEKNPNHAGYDNIEKFKPDHKTKGSLIVYRCIIDKCKGNLKVSSNGEECKKDAETQKREKNIDDLVNKIKQSASTLTIGTKLTVTKSLMNEKLVDAALDEWHQACRDAVVNRKIMGADESVLDDRKEPNSTLICLIKSCKPGYEKSKDEKSCLQPGMTSEQAAQNNCAADGGEWKNNTCDCKDSRVWSESNQSCMDKSMLSPEERAEIPNSDLEKEMVADIQKLTEAFQSVVKKLTAECVGGGGYVQHYECFDQ